MDEDVEYSSRLFNIRGYMSEVINKIEVEILKDKERLRQTLEGKGAERAELRERKQAMAHMLVNKMPDRGAEHIHINSPTLEIYENLQTEETEI